MAARQGNPSTSSTTSQPLQTNSLSHADSVSSSSVRIDIPAESRRRLIHRVPLQLRGNQGLYDPMGLSLGPYHHGVPRCRRMEELKDRVVNLFVSNSIAINAAKDRDFFHRQIWENINEIRSNYEEVEYSNEGLSEIILRDVCFVIYYMEIAAKEESICEKLGLSLWSGMFIMRDIMLLENQIPLRMIRRLLDSRFRGDEAEKLICRFLDIECFPWDDEPLHLLEAERMIKFTARPSRNRPPMRTTTIHTLLTLCLWTQKWCLKATTCSGYGENNCNTWVEKKSLPFRSVTHLKANGINFVPIKDCLTNVKFTPHLLHGTLKIPVLSLNTNSRAYLSNIIALELSWGNEEDLVATSYVNFMRSLIEKAEDVKELRKRAILLVKLENGDQVVKLFNEIDAHGFDNYRSYADVKQGINDHCKSKIKTWKAGFVRTYLRRPWNVAAPYCAIAALYFTIIQALK